MIFKRFKPFHEPSKFVFKDPDTGRNFNAVNMANLITLVEGYRSQNKLPKLDLLETVIINYLCDLPIHKGLCEPVKGPKRSFMAYVRGGVALLKNIAYQNFASQEIADQRSEICTHCPHNIFPDKGPFLKWADDIAERSIGERKSKYHDQLGICELCSCPLRAKTFHDGKVQLTKKQFEDMSNVKEVSCWQVPLAEVK